MRLRRLLLLLLSLFSSLLIVSSVACIDAYALSGGKYLTVAESLQIFGSEIPYSYYNGNDYVQGTFQYDTTDSIVRTYGTMPDNWSDYSGMTYLRYVATTSGLVADPNYITVDISPSYSIFDTEQIYSLIALSSSSSYGAVSTVYQSPSWDWVIGGQSVHYENNLTQSGGKYSGLLFSVATCTFVPMAFSSQSSTSGYSTRAVFCGNNGNTLYLFIGCPYVSSSAAGSNGTFTQTSGGNINVDVDIDMSETNSLLENISSAISGIWSGITGVFVPDSNFVDSWRAEMSDALEDSFGRYPELDATLNQVQSSFATAEGSAMVSFPGISPPGITSILPAVQVNAVPEPLAGVHGYVKFAVNILVTGLFYNSMKRKIDEIILGKTVVEIESG